MKKTVALFLALVMVFGLLACTGTPAAQTPSSGTSQSSGSQSASSGSSASTGTAEAPSVTGTEAQQNEVEAVEVNVSTYQEAPMLAEKVAAGELPPVDERIPNQDNVFVETNDASGKALSIGVYGGVINQGPAGGSWGLSRPSLESIIRYNTDGTYYPNVIKAYEHNDDYTVWTFYLREGMRWSDGDDFNADDITFWYYMCHLNNFDSKKSWAALKESVDGADAWAKLTKVDDYTVTWTFVNPKYPADFIMNGDFKWCWAPSHYLNDLVPDCEGYAWVENEYWPSTGLSEEQVLANAKAKGIDSATVKDLGKAVAYNSWNVAGIPQVNCFVLLTGSRNDPLCILERNPYFWKVDQAGNQLPYLDALHFNATSADGQDLLMFRSGDLDIIEVGMQDIASILSELGDKVEVHSYSSSNWGSYQITFNYTCKDPNYANLFANAAFREGMSICVDRSQVSQLLTDGFLEPGQCAPAEGNWGYDAEWEQKWTEYDVAKAQQLFESCGLVKGSDGFYTFADGTPLLITFYEYDGGVDTSYPVLEKYFKAAGINCALKNFEVGAFDTEIDNNDWIAVMGPHTSIGGLSLYDRVAPFVPVQQAAEWYGDYGTWYGTNGAQGVEPTGDFAKLIEYYEEWRAIPDPADREPWAEKIYELHKQNLWSLAYLKAEAKYVLMNSNVKNYATVLVDADLYQYANIAHYEVLYKAQQ